MALRKQRKLIVEKCEAREMLSADGLALPAPAELSEPAAELAYVVAISKLDDKATTIPGDFDADGDCDGDDYLVWQVGFGNGEMDGDDWLTWQVGYGSQAETLRAEAIPGDFDVDGDCDGDDYLIWQVCWCTGELDGEDWLAWQVGYGSQAETLRAEAIPGDFDVDGDCDGDDYLIWQVCWCTGELDGEDWLAWQVGYGSQAETLRAEAIPGDFDVDGDCDGGDYLVWQVCWCTGELDGEDWLAWQANYGMNVTAESDIGSNRIDRGDALPNTAGRPFGKRWALATDVAIEQWARSTTA